MAETAATADTETDEAAVEDSDGTSDGGGDTGNGDDGATTAPEQTDDAPGGDAESGSGVPRWWLVAGTVMACLPIAVAAIRAIRDGWRPTGDDAFPAIRAGDVFTSHPPLIGWWSSASQYAGRELNHPGPLQFDSLAIPVWLFGPGVGTIVGTAAINALSIVLIVWLLRRRLDVPATALAIGASAVLVWSFGSETLYDPWTMLATLLPFALFLVAAWGLASRDLVAAPIMVVAGGFALQTHLTYSLLVPGIAALAVAWPAFFVVVRWRRGEPLAPAQRMRVLRWGLITALVGLLTWAQPLYEQFVDHEGPEGNLRALAGSLDVEQATPSMEQAVGAFGGTVAVPPMWLPPSYGSPAFGYLDNGPPMWLSGLALVVLAAALGFFGWRAFRRGSTAVVAGVVVALACLPVGLYTTLRMPMPHLGVPTTYSRFMWPLGMVVWLALAVAVLDEVRARWPRFSVRQLAVPGLALALLGGIAGLPTAHRDSEPEWTWQALDAVDDDMVRAVEEAGGGPVVVDIPYHTTTAFLAPPLLYQLQDAGIDFYLQDMTLVRQLGKHRLYEDGDARLRLVILGGSFTDAAGVDGEQVAYWSELTQDERDEFDEINAELEGIIAEHGLVLNEGGERFLEAFGQNADLVRLEIDGAQADPASVMFPDRTLVDLWNGLDHKGPMLDTDLFPAELMDRWVELGGRYADRQVAIRLEQLD